MSFLNSAFLIGLFAVFIPILIHLLSRKKPKRIDFSDLRFLQLAARRSVNKFRIKQYLLLLIRCLLIIILTLIFARPVIHYTSASNNVETVFLIDNSYSMDYYKDGKTRLAVAKDVVKKIVSLLNPQEQISVFSFSDALSDVVKNPTTDRQLILTELEKTKISYRKTDTVNAINGLTNYFQNNQYEKRIVLISDFAKNGWYEKKDIFNEKHRIICVDVGDNNAENFAVSNIETDNNQISAEISNLSIADRKISGSIYIDTKKYKDMFFETKAAKPIFTTFNLKNIENGIHRCFVEIENDKLLADNKHFFAFNFRQKPKILLVDGNPQFSDFKGETYFLKTALSNYATVKIINYSQFENELLDDYSALFLCNVSNFDKTTAMKLNHFISKNGCLVFFLGDKVSIDNYNTSIRFLLPGEISKILNGGNLSDYGLTANSEEIIKNTNIIRRFLLIPEKDSEVVFKFADDTPLLIKNNQNVFVFAVSANLNFSDIPVKPSFPIIIKRIMDYLVQSDTVIQSKKVGEKFERKNILLVTEIITPDSQIVKSPTDFVFDQPGVYEIKYKNRKTEFCNVNLDTHSGESDLTKINTAELKKILDKLYVGIVLADRHLEKNVKKLLYGNEITKYFLSVLLILVILETVIANLRMK
ncbi:MAG: VWA domain-containing protein [Elusimicrobiota bacterium]